MPAKWHKYSYTAQRKERLALVSVVVYLIILAFLFILVNTFAITMYQIETTVMEPALNGGDRVLTTPLYCLNPGVPQFISQFTEPKRGELAVIAPLHKKQESVFVSILNACSAFLTFQQIHIFESRYDIGEKPALRRIVALPGDTLFMENFILHVKPRDSQHFLTEFELSSESYDLNLDPLPKDWDETLPFSASFPEMTLGENEYFVLTDTRRSSSDSRIQGIIPAERIRGKVLARYWPPDQIMAY